MQYPVERAGVKVGDLVETAVRARGNGDVDTNLLAGSEPALCPRRVLDRGVNDEFSGGEKKRMETLKLVSLEATFRRSRRGRLGLDVDALRDVARRVEAMTTEETSECCDHALPRGLLTELRPDRVHILMAGRVVKSGGPELAEELERTGYEGIAAELGVEEVAVVAPKEADPFASRGFEKRLLQLGRVEVHSRRRDPLTPRSRGRSRLA